MAYAFLLYRRDKLLKEVAEKRLAAIREFTDLYIYLSADKIVHDLLQLPLPHLSVGISHIYIRDEPLDPGRNQENKQVVYLVPTTILAQQHYNTFLQRMKDFPVRVDLMCRFRTPAQQKKTIEDLQRGLVDIRIPSAIRCPPRTHSLPDPASRRTALRHCDWDASDFKRRRRI